MKVFYFLAVLLAFGFRARGENHPPAIVRSDDIRAEKNTSVTLSYEKLKELSGAYDADGDVVFLQISAVVNGRLTKNGQPVSPGVSLVGPGESLSWTPPTNVFNTWIAAFKVRGYDLKNYSDTVEIIGASIIGNNPPELTSIHIFSKENFQNAKMNTPYSVAFTTLREASDLRDLDEDPVSFLIASVHSGTLTMDGVPVVAGQTVFRSTNTLSWRPANNVIGDDVSAFSVKGFDGKESSATPVVVKVDVTDPTPRFKKGADQVVVRTSQDVYVWNWATDIRPDDSVLHFEVSNNNPALFLNQPEIDADGTLLYSLEGTASGIANVTVVLVDADGRRSVPQTFSITVLREPTFSLRTTSLTANFLPIANCVPGFAFNIAPGTAPESKAVTFKVTALEPTFFSGKPAISTNGCLTYKLAANASGTTLVSVMAGDGKLSSGPQTVSISVPANPFTARKGNYAGLFFEDDEVRHQSSGLFNLSLTENGTCSGKISIAGAVHSFSGTFNLSRQMKATVWRKNRSSLNLTVQLGDDVLNGTIGDSQWMASLQACRTGFSTNNPSSQAGNYTMVLRKGLSGPAGNSVASITSSTTGVTVFSGTLADGTKFTQSGVLSKSRQIPLYLSLYQGNGSMLGWINLSNSITGNVSWIKTTNTLTGYKAPFTNDVGACGSVFRTNTPALNISNGLVLLTNATPRLALQANVSAVGNTFSGNGLTFSVNPKSGLITGKYFHPVSKTYAPVFGAVLQNQNNVSGFYLGEKDSGELAGFKK